MKSQLNQSTVNNVTGLNSDKSSGVTREVNRFKKDDIRFLLLGRRS